MRPVIPVVAFLAGYQVGSEIRGRLLRGRKPLSFERMTGEIPLLEKFRLTRKPSELNNDSLDEVSSYLLSNTDLTDKSIYEAMKRQ